MTLDPNLLADLARAANSEKAKERSRAEEALEALRDRAVADMSTLLPILERYVQARAAAGHFRATVYQWTASTCLGLPYGFYYSASFPEREYGAQTAHTEMTKACLPFFRKYHSVIKFADVASYIAAYFRSSGFRADIVPQYFHLQEAAIDDLWWGDGWSLIVSWATNETSSDAAPKPWWRFW